MKVITLRNLSPELSAKLRQRSRQTGNSLAKTVVSLLEERLGIGSARARPDTDDELEALAGSWSEDQADLFDQSLAEQRTVDPEIWR
jgi:hypothetical protein